MLFDAFQKQVVQIGERHTVADKIDLEVNTGLCIIVPHAFVSAYLDYNTTLVVYLEMSLF